MMCVCQVALRREEKPDLPFHKAYIFGPSTKNQRIKAQQNTLADSLTESQKKFFESLVHGDIFDSESTYDVTALRYIYMGKLRSDIYNFVEVYNIHRIQKQKNRVEYLYTGVPKELFFFPENARNYSTLATDSQIFIALQDKVKTFDIKLYQTRQVEELCTRLLRQSGITYDLELMNTGLDQPHVRAYDFLRQALRIQEDLGDNKLEILQPPRGAMQWVAKMAEAEEQLGLAQSLNRRPEDIPKEEAVSEYELNSDDDDDSGGSDNECILG